MQSVHPLRVLIKAAFIFGCINLGFAFFSPPIGTLSIFNRFILGRLRFNVPVTGPDQNSRDALIFEDLDAMFASHVVSTGLSPKMNTGFFFLGTQPPGALIFIPKILSPSKSTGLISSPAMGGRLELMMWGFCGPQ